MKIRKISKCFNGDSTQYIVISTLDAIVAVFFKDSKGTIYRIHYLTSLPHEQHDIQEAIKNA